MNITKIFLVKPDFQAKKNLTEHHQEENILTNFLMTPDTKANYALSKYYRENILTNLLYAIPLFATCLRPSQGGIKDIRTVGKTLRGLPINIWTGSSNLTSLSTGPAKILGPGDGGRRGLPSLRSPRLGKDDIWNPLLAGSTGTNFGTYIS